MNTRDATWGEVAFKGNYHDIRKPAVVLGLPSSSSMLCRASEVFGHCERPHLLFDKDGFTPIALTNGVKIQGLSNDDQSFTLLRPLQR
jgi:hypothetical protein